VNSTGLGWVHLTASGECGNEPSGSISLISGEFEELLKEDSVHGLRLDSNSPKLNSWSLVCLTFLTQPLFLILLMTPQDVQQAYVICASHRK
jgi:hypothetical protein